MRQSEEDAPLPWFTETEVRRTENMFTYSLRDTGKQLPEKTGTTGTKGRYRQQRQCTQQGRRRRYRQRLDHSGGQSRRTVTWVKRTETYGQSCLSNMSNYHEDSGGGHYVSWCLHECSLRGFSSHGRRVRPLGLCP